MLEKSEDEAKFVFRFAISKHFLSAINETHSESSKA